MIFKKLGQFGQTVLEKKSKSKKKKKTQKPDSLRDGLHLAGDR